MRPEFNFVASQSLPSFWMSTPSSFSTSELSAPPRMAGLGSADASDGGDAMNRNHMAIVVAADDLGDRQFLFVSIAITAIHSSRHFCGCTHPRPESLSCNDHVEIISRHFVPVIGAFDRVITATIPRLPDSRFTKFDDQHRPVPHWLKYCNPLLGRSPSANWRDERRSATTARPRLLLEPGGECRRARNCAKM